MLEIFAYSFNDISEKVEETISISESMVMSEIVEFIAKERSSH